MNTSHMIVTEAPPFCEACQGAFGSDGHVHRKWDNEETRWVCRCCICHDQTTTEKMQFSGMEKSLWGLCTSDFKKEVIQNG